MLFYHRIPSIKWLRVLLLPPGWDASPSQDTQHKVTRSITTPPGWDASPSQVYPQQYLTLNHLYTWVERDCAELSYLSRKMKQWQGVKYCKLLFLFQTYQQSEVCLYSWHISCVTSLLWSEAVVGNLMFTLLWLLLSCCLASLNLAWIVWVSSIFSLNVQFMCSFSRNKCCVASCDLSSCV